MLNCSSPERFSDFPTPFKTLNFLFEAGLIGHSMKERERQRQRVSRGGGKKGQKSNFWSQRNRRKKVLTHQKTRKEGRTVRKGSFKNNHPQTKTPSIRNF